MTMVAVSGRSNSSAPKDVEVSSHYPNIPPLPPLVATNRRPTYEKAGKMIEIKSPMVTPRLSSRRVSSESGRFEPYGSKERDFTKDVSVYGSVYGKPHIDEEYPGDVSSRVSTVSGGNGESTDISPMSVESLVSGKPKNKSLLVPCVAVYSSNYNFTVLAVAMVIMELDPAYKAAASQNEMKSTIKMLCYGGAVLGQFMMGYVGDYLGRKKGMVLTLVLVFLGALLSGVGCWGDAATVMALLAFYRTILGVGNGGVYPLSAVSAAEGTASSNAEDRSPRVSIAYMFNVPGIMSPYLLALILWNITENFEVNWRVLLAFGALPAFCILWSAIRTEDSDEYKQSGVSQKLWNALFNRLYWSKLIGTGCCWFLYDVAAYGILLIQPDITQRIWASDVTKTVSQTVNDTIWQGLVLNAMGIPGVLMGVLVVKQMGTKWLQFWGFILMALTAALLGIVYSLAPQAAGAQMFCLALVNYALNWGAAITTFILPSEVFPPECRSTYNGISAAMGKIGAVVGIYSLKAAMDAWDVGPMMAIAALTCLLGAVLTWFYVGTVPKTWKGALTQCFGSLLACIPFFDPRPRLGL